MKILHLIRSLADERALQIAQAQQKEHEVTLLLLHDAVLSDISFAGPIYACRDDLLARGDRHGYQAIDYDGIVQLILAHDKVISW